MVESKLRVETKEVSNDNSPYYGNSLIKNVVEEVHYHDCDKRVDIAPCGVMATIKVGDVVFDISVSRHFFDHEGEGGYLAYFHISDVTYELYVKFNDNDEIEDIWLSEWLTYGEFEDGDDADNVYKNVDFTTIDTLEN